MRVYGCGMEWLENMESSSGRLLKKKERNKERNGTIVSQLSVKIRFLKMTASFQPISRQWSESSAERCALAA